MKRRIKFSKKTFLIEQVSDNWEYSCSKIQRPGLPHCFSENRRYICGKGFTWFGSYCESRTLLPLQVVRFRITQGHYHELIHPWLIHPKAKRSNGGCVSTSWQVLLSCEFYSIRHWATTKGSEFCANHS